MCTLISTVRPRGHQGSSRLRPARRGSVRLAQSAGSEHREMHTTQRQVQGMLRGTCTSRRAFLGAHSADVWCRGAPRFLHAVARGPAQPHDERCAWALGRSVSTDACDAETGAGHAALHLYEAGVYLPGRAAGLRAAKTRPLPPSEDSSFQKRHSPVPFVELLCF